MYTSEGAAGTGTRLVSSSEVGNCPAQVVDCVSPVVRWVVVSPLAAAAAFPPWVSVFVVVRLIGRTLCHGELYDFVSFALLVRGYLHLQVSSPAKQRRRRPSQVVTGFFCEHAFEMARSEKDSLIQEHRLVTLCKWCS